MEGNGFLSAKCVFGSILRMSKWSLCLYLLYLVQIRQVKDETADCIEDTATLHSKHMAVTEQKG